MRVLALNCSPHMERGMTALIMKPFLDGMREGGAEVEVVVVQKLTIHHCQADYSCWVQTPGLCFQQDDMQALYPKLRSADVIVFSSPVYSDGVSGLMKDVMDRCIAFMDPTVQVQDNRCQHLMREGIGKPDVVLISTCGLWELDHFGPLVEHLTAWCNNQSRRFAGALLRPHGSALAPRWNVPSEDVLGAARDAGRQMAATGSMHTETLAIVSRELLPRDEYVARMNEGFRHRRAKLGMA